MVAVITDVHYRMSLAIMRDLKEQGITVIACEKENVPAPLGFVSRASDRNVTLPAEKEAMLDALYAICEALYRESGARPALLPVGAVTLNALAEDAVSRRFSEVAGLCIGTKAQLDLLNNKEAVSSLAARCGVPVPQSYVMGSDEAESAFFSRIPMPCVIKPLCGEKLNLTASKRYVIANTAAEAQKAYRHYLELAGEPPVVQKYLSGDGLGCSAICCEGKVYGAICHRRIREYPVSGGPSACCDCIDLPELQEYVQRLAAETGFSGPAMFEFKNDADGKPHLLEVNPRIWGSYPLTRVAGSGSSMLWFLLAWQKGNPETAVSLPASAPKPCRMHFTISDLLAGIGYAKKGRPGKLFQVLADCLKPGVRDGLFERKDPRPGRMYVRSLMKRGGK